MTNSRTLRLSVMLISITICAVSAWADSKYEGCWVRITLPPSMTYESQAFTGLDIIRFEGMPENIFEAVISPQEYRNMLHMGYEVELLSADYNRTMREISDHFYTNEASFAFIDSLFQLYPDIVRIDSIGSTYENRTIWCVKISENVAVDDPQKLGVFYSGSIHANELAGTTVVLTLMDEILTSYASGDQSMIDWLGANQLWIVPILNPDGVAYVHNNQDITWRKNRSPSGGNDYGVDLNRNFGYMWGCDDEGSSPDPSQWNYRGAAPFSELETQAIREFFEGEGHTDRNIVSAITYHMKYNSGVFLYPWYYADAYTRHHAVYLINAEEFTSITGTIHGNAREAMGYNANGSLDEWLYIETEVKPKIICSTVECGGIGMMPEGYPIELLLSTHIPANIQHLEATQSIADRVRIVDACGDPILSDTYLKPGTDTLRVQVLLQEDSTSFQAVGHITEGDDISIESIYFFDDGNHGDFNSSDSIFGASWIVPDDVGEGFFNFYLEGILGDSISLDLHTRYPITTAGPVQCGEIQPLSGNLPQPGNLFRFYLPAINAGLELIIPAVSVMLSLEEAAPAELIGDAERPYGGIAAGDSVANLIPFQIQISENCPEDTSIVVYAQINSSGTFYWADSFTIHIEPEVGIKSFSSGMPKYFNLEQNYPNPFNPSTSIRYGLPQEAYVSLVIYDVRGQLIQTLESGHQSAGWYDVTWNGETTDGYAISTGIYFARLVAADYSQVIKMLYLK